MIVRRLWRFPVKSVGGERLDEVEVSELGLANDRGWAIFEAGTDKGLTARREPKLFFASASATADGDVVITLPDGEQTADDAVLSRWLGYDVELRKAGDVGGTYEVPIDFEKDENWVSWTGPGGAFHDSPRSRVSLVSTATLGDWDERRFRTNIILDGAGEDDLVGSTVTLGQCTMSIMKQIDRCVLVTRPQPGLERDLELLKTINRERATNLAIGAVPTVGGRVAIGDALDGEFGAPRETR